jgi:hypothetical protein
MSNSNDKAKQTSNPVPPTKTRPVKFIKESADTPKPRPTIISKHSLDLSENAETRRK